MDYTTMSPKEVRALIAKGEITGPTAGMCAGYAQANLVILPKDLAYDFLLFTQRNPRSCPLLEVSDTGSRFLRTIAKDADIATKFRATAFTATACWMENTLISLRSGRMILSAS